MKPLKEYAVYRGEDLLCIGTAPECAEFMGWSKASNTHFYASASYRKRVKEDGNAVIAIKLEDEEDE